MAAQKFGGEHTDLKIEILRRYLNSYTTALKCKGFELVYLDPFCGSGFYETQSEQDEDRELHTGSALAALQISDKPFDRLMLNDINQKNIEALKTEICKEFPDRNVHFGNTDANLYVSQTCAQQLSKKGWDGTRGVIFLDPFATEVSWDTIETIARTKALDLWLLFPRKALSRVARKSVDVDLDLHPHRATLDRVFGDASWRLLYDGEFIRDYNMTVHVDKAWQPQLGDQFIDPEHSTRGSEAMIAYLYKQRLISVLPWVSNVRAALYINGQPHFELMFAASNPRANAGELATRIADYILENYPSVQIKD